MALSDPQSITVNSVAKSLPRVSFGDGQATYRSADEQFQLRISHKPAKGRKRHMIRIDQTVVAADPLTAENASQNLGVYLVVDEPSFGFDDTTIDYLVVALRSFCVTATMLRVLGGES